MRISTLAIAISVAAGTALALPPLNPTALAVQGQAATISGIETVCTGVGSDKDNPTWSGYPVKLVFADPKGADVAQEHVAVLQGGSPIVETDCDAPWVLMKLPPGDYSVRAMLRNGGTQTVAFSTNGEGQKTVTVTMPAETASAQ
jgi:hypothetical protein